MPIMRPQDPPMTWRQFKKNAPVFSIALDGYVKGGYKLDLKGPHANFNHHEGVSRLETKATCAQILMAVRKGLFNLFKDEKGNRAYVYMNDCDQDVCLSWFLLKYAHFAKYAINPILNRLVFIEDMLDSTAGAYSYPENFPTLEQISWVFEPYHLFRLSGRLENKNPGEFLSTLSYVENRIMKHILGQGDSIPLDTRFEKLGGGPDWIMVKEIGAQARMDIAAQGHSIYVSVRERPDGRKTFTIAKLSPYVRCPLPRIFRALNQEEGLLRNPDCWGGAIDVGGSPRVKGSGLPLDKITEIMNKHLKC